MSNKTNINNNSCPICNKSSKRIIDLDRNFIKNKLSKHFNNRVDDKVKIIDYSILKCNNCDFEYAFPLIEGSPSFYNWVTEQKNYYPVSRWEYIKVLDVVKKNNEYIKLLDVGCGDGQFLDFLKENINGGVDFFGLDPTKLSADKCKIKGHNVYCMDVLKFKSTFENEIFDIITVFHVLEHIGNPKLFLKDLLNLINNTGKILVSTPFSPMDFELDWFDILNHPPHHMGRWNLKSYKNLALELDLNVKFYMPKPNSIINSALTSFFFSMNGPSKPLTKKNKVLAIFKKPFNFIYHLFKQSKRENIMGRRAANVILVEFSKQS